MKQVFYNNHATNYYITEDGKLYNSKTNKWLKGQINKLHGYLSYNISIDGHNNKKRINAHRLVANAYIPNPQNKPQINHKDGNKLNNNVENLEWVTAKENQQHAIEQELRKFKHVYCFNKDKELVAEYKSIPEASKATGICKTCIVQEINKDIKSLSGGFYWSRENKLNRTKNYPNTGKAKKVLQYDLKGKYINTYESTGCAARSLKCKSSHIGDCCRGKIKSYKGFIWRYAEDIVLSYEKS